MRSFVVKVVVNDEMGSTAACIWSITTPLLVLHDSTLHCHHMTTVPYNHWMSVSDQSVSGWARFSLQINAEKKKSPFFWSWKCKISAHPDSMTKNGLAHFNQSLMSLWILISNNLIQGVFYAFSHFFHFPSIECHHIIPLNSLVIQMTHTGIKCLQITNYFALLFTSVLTFAHIENIWQLCDVLQSW